MLDQLKRVLSRLQATVGARSEKAYLDRDAKGASRDAQSYAAGEAHAYGEAENDIRTAQRDED